MVDQASEPDDSDEVPQGLIPFLCAQLKSTQYALVEARGEVASLREEVTAKDAEARELVARFQHQVTENEARITEHGVRIAQQEAWRDEIEARIVQRNAEINADIAMMSEALASKDARIADLIAQVQLLTAQQDRTGTES